MEKNTKQCKKCNLIKCLKDFYKDNRITSIVCYRSICIECYKKESKIYNTINHDKNIIRLWESRGIKFPNFKNLYQLYMQSTNCYFCDILFDNSIKSKRRCLDHCYLSGSPRFIICSRCNINVLPKIDRIKNKLHLELHRYFNRV